jgi:hypothetical protein
LGCSSDNRLISTCWNPYRFFRKRETNHSEKLNDAYAELKKITVDEEENHKVSLKVHNKQLDDIKYFSQALLHLKSYKQIYKTWKTLSILEDNINGKLDELESIQKKLIREKARNPQNYPNHTAVLEKPTANQEGQDCYNMMALMNDIYNYLYRDELQGVLLSDYIYHEKHQGNTYLLTNDSHVIIVESKNELDSKREKLILLLESVLVDKELRKEFTDLRNARTELDRTVKKFSDDITI